MELKKFDYHNLKIKTDINESDFFKNFLNEELFSLLKDKKLINNSLYIHKAYVYNNTDYIELGLYITNTSEKNILIRDLPITIMNNDKKIIKILNVNKELEKEKSIFKELQIEKRLLGELDKLNNFEIIIDDLNGIEKYKPIELELNLEPKFRKYISKREFNKFIKNLPKINENNLAINVFKRAYIKEGYFISLIFRNSSSNDININTLPIVVTTANKLIIYEGVMEFKDNNCLIPSNKAILKNIIIPYDDFPKLPDCDGMDFKILFKNL